MEWEAEVCRSGWSETWSPICDLGFYIDACFRYVASRFLSTKISIITTPDPFSPLPCVVRFSVVVLQFLSRFISGNRFCSSGLRHDRMCSPAYATYSVLIEVLNYFARNMTSWRNDIVTAMLGLGGHAILLSVDLFRQPSRTYRSHHP